MRERSGYDLELEQCICPAGNIPEPKKNLSLLMLIIIPVIIGIALRSNTNMVIVLALYGIAVLVRQVADAFASLPTSVLEAADSLGYPALRRQRDRKSVV